MSRKHRVSTPVLTPEQQKYKDGLAMLLKECDDAKKTYQEARKLCAHVIYRDGYGEYDPKGDGGSAVCAVCGAGFGWWCPDSPDHACHYFTIGSPERTEFDDDDEVPERLGLVRLLTGALVVPPEHDADYETDDGCLWCGQPDERK